MKPHTIVSSTQNVLRVPRRAIGRLVPFLAKAEGVRFAEVDIAIVGADEMATHNRRFLGHRGATDVISFDLTDEGERRGGLSAQLIICAAVAREQGPHHGLAPTHELLLYIIHGLLHVIGYDDTDVRAAARMHARQDELLRKFLRTR